MRRYRPLPAVLFAILVSALVGGLFGRSALATDDKVPEHYRAFTAALNAIETSYIDKVDSDNLVYGAVRGMLGTLDPHSSFFSPKEYAQMRERQEGRYYGIGVSIQAIDGDITAMQVFEQSPAYKKGIRRGDVMANVEGEDTKGWTVDQAMRKLRGPKGTTVYVGVRRRGFPEMIKFELVRDEVYIPTVPAYFMIDDTTGYIRMQDFGENTDRDVKHALHDLNAKGMKRLLFDIRGNPGRAARSGDQGVERVPAQGQDDRLHARPRAELGSGLSRDGRQRVHRDADRRAGQPQQRERGGDRSGALQDHDRAYLVGETTFGKALVQSVYRISGGAGLALTTAHYYTPSGRIIQRPWDASFDEYLSYTLRDQDANKPHNPSDLKRTDAGRPVYAGGGIEPDKRVAGPLEGFNPARFGRMLVARGEFANYAQKFAAEGDTRVTQTSTNRKLVKRNFVVDEAMVADFREQMKADKLKIDEEAFAKDIEFIKAMIRFEIDNAVFGIADARRHLIGVDPQAQAALQMFGEAQKLTELSKSSKIKANH